jgi:hypothetical protein
MLESICDDPAIIERNIRSVKISSPDYRSWDPDLAVQDYYNRIRGHEKHYETVDELDVPSIRIINVGEKIMVNVRSFHASLAFACRSNQRFLLESPGLSAGKKNRVVLYHVRDL